MSDTKISTADLRVAQKICRELYDNATFERHHMELFIQTNKALEAALHEARTALDELHEQQLEIDKLNGKWLLKSRETRDAIKDIVEGIKG